MKKLIILFLAAVMCLSLCACGEENDTSSTTEESVKPLGTNTENETTTAEESIKTADPNTENETTPTPDYASALADILCSGKWVSMDGRDEITFNANGTFSWISDEGNEEWTWGYREYFNSFVDIPIPIAAAPAEDSCVYWGNAHDAEGSDYVHGHPGMMVGHDEEGNLVMSFDGKPWIREE